MPTPSRVVCGKCAICGGLWDSPIQLNKHGHRRLKHPNRETWCPDCERAVPNEALEWHLENKFHLEEKARKDQQFGTDAAEFEPYESLPYEVPARPAMRRGNNYLCLCGKGRSESDLRVCDTLVQCDGCQVWG